MSNYFKKVNFNLNFSFNIIEKELLFKYGAISYFKIIDKFVVDEINQKFKYNKPTKIFFSEIYSYLDPHIDQGSKSCFNYYIHGGNYITKFWKIKNPNYITVSTNKKDSGDKLLVSLNNKYFHKDLMLEEEFVADNNSSYILNIGEIHSVERFHPIGIIPRKMIQLQWDCNFNDLVEIIKINLGENTIHCGLSPN